MILFFRYIAGRARLILMMSLFSVIFAVTFWLYHLPLDAVIYPALLCALFAFIFMIIDFSRVKQKHRELSILLSLDASMMDTLPEYSGIDDADYQAVIRHLQKEVTDLEQSSDEKYRDMIEYYTIWAHQIKTPIASMRLHLQNEDTAVSRKLLSDLFRVEQYAEMVLAFLRLNSTSSDYVFREYPVDAIIRQAVKKFSGEFILRKIALRYEPTDRRIVTDEKWFLFVLEQIISNALKYTKEGCIKIYMRDADTLCIEDSGIGIAPQDLPRIFENGYTGYNGRSDKKASGIGLYLCKRICDRLGIKISARSELGVGTVIELGIAQYRLRAE